MSKFTQDRFTSGGTRASSLYHLTVDTGQSLTTPGSAVPSDILSKLKSLLKVGRTASIGAGLAARVDTIPGGWRFDLFQDRPDCPPLVSCYVAAPQGGVTAWATLCRDRRSLKRSATTMPRPTHEPWLSVFFRPGFFLEAAATQRILGDAERCIAWTLLTHFRPGRAEAPVSPPTPDGCVDERALTCSALSDLVFGGGGQRSQPEPRKSRLPGGTLASGLVAVAADVPKDGRMRELARLIQQAGRLELADEIVKVADALGGTLPDLLKWYRLPFEPTWLEWRDRQPADLLGVNENSQPFRSGILIWRDASGRVFVQGALAYPEGPGITDVVAAEAENLASDLKELVLTALRMLVVITAKGAPVIVGVPVEDYTRLNRQRIKKGKSPLMTLQPVRWALSQSPQAGGDMHKDGGADGSRKRRAHLQRGHLKCRETGVFWWGPHWRNLDNRQPPPTGGRDHQVRK